MRWYRVGGEQVQLRHVRREHARAHRGDPVGVDSYSSHDEDEDGDGPPQ